MALLWSQVAAQQREAMAWHSDPKDVKKGIDPSKAIPVKKAGFAGYVGESEDRRSDYGEDPVEHEFDEDRWDDTTPEPTEHEQAHYDKHGEYPDEHHERHEQAYQEATDKHEAESAPDHEDDDLHEFTAEHGSDTSLWQNKAKLGKVDLSKGVYATQSHVHPAHIDRHEVDDGQTPWHAGGGSDYLGHKHPMFVTHEGRLHVTEGHHRVARALARGDTHMEGWHYDGDKHGLPGYGEEDD